MGEVREAKVVGYTRMSSTSQIDNLERQKQLIEEHTQQGHREVEVLSNISSGLNEKRRSYLKLLGMVAERKVSAIIVTYRDRLTRFGFETLNCSHPSELK